MNTEKNDTANAPDEGENEASTDANADRLQIAGEEAFFSGKIIRFAPIASPDLPGSATAQKNPAQSDRTVIFPLPTNNEDEEPEKLLDEVEEKVSFLLDFFQQETDSEEDESFVTNFQSVFSIAEEESPTDSPMDMTQEEFLQREEEQARLENIDALIRDNNAGTLYELGDKYGHSAVERSETGSAVEISPSSILEAMLFVGDRENRPLSIKRAIAPMRNVSEEEALLAIDALNARYTRNGAPYQIVETQEGYRLVLRPEFEPIRERFLGKSREFKLSLKAIEILSLIAYRQPISGPEIQEIRPGAGSLLPLLLKRGLIESENREVEGKPSTYYRTTARFLEVFGIDSLDDLPMIDEIDFR